MTRTHQPCPDCGSSDALTDYGDHTHCFSCGKTTGGDEGAEGGGNLIPLADISIQKLNSRAISSATCRRFTYGVASGLQVATYWDPIQRLPVFQKTRDKDKNFRVLKNGNTNCRLKELLFGRHLWGSHGGKSLVICEGEIDTLAAHEALGSLGVHSVGLPCGANGALDAVRSNYDWIDSYQSIYLGFDSDDPGREASLAVAGFLGSPKVHQINLPPGIKDLGELLVSGGSSAVQEAYFEAQQWKPSGIISQDDYLKIVTEEPQRGIPWPWPSLNETTYGIIPGLTLFAAGSGVGKTTAFKQVEAHCLSLGKRIGVIHLEESAKMTINSLLSLLYRKDYHTPDSKVSLSDRTTAVSALTASGNLVLYDKSVGFDEDLILGTIRYLVKVLSCELVFLDHLTAITDQYDSGVNQKTRNLIVKIGKLVTTLGFPLLAISHLRKAEGKSHEEGGRVHLDDLLGSGAIKQWAEHVFALERNNQDEDPEARNMPRLRDLKNRPMGEHTGTVLPLRYVPETFTLEEAFGFNQESLRPFPDTPF